MPYRTGDNNYGVAKWIVDPTLGQGTHQTITAALTSAASGDTIFIRPGTYTENLTLKAGVNITSFTCEGDVRNGSNVVINGKTSFTAAGKVVMSGLSFKNTAALDYCISVTGASGSTLELTNCFILAAQNSAIQITGSGNCNLSYCGGDFSTSGFNFFDNSSSGTLTFEGCLMGDGASTTASTASGSGNLNIFNSSVAFPITVSGSQSLTADNSQFLNSGINTTLLTFGGSGTGFIRNCSYDTGTASAVSIGGTLTMAGCIIRSSNTNAITGAGTLRSADLSFVGSSSTINTSTVTRVPMASIYAPTGISFDNTNVMSTYATGTWTPALAFGGSSTGITYTTQLGKYWQIGAVVHYDVFIILSSKGAQTGSATVSLPFASASDGHFPVQSLLFSGTINAFPTSTTQATGYIAPGSSLVTLWSQGSSTVANVTNTTFSNTTQIQLTGFYWTS